MTTDRREDSALLLRQLTRWGQAHPSVVTMGAAIFCTLVGAVDYVSGDLISPNIFYVLPVVVTTASAGRRSGLLIIGVATLIGFLAAASGVNNPSPPIIAWNLLARVVFLVGSVWLVDALVHTLEQLEARATTDPLTGALNRRALYDLTTREMARCERAGAPMSVAYFDLDGLKAVNDTAGHDAGDALIVSFVDELRSHSRPTDLAARLGGDEFALVLPELGLADAEIVVRRLQVALAEHGVSASAGIAAIDTSLSDIEPAIQRADQLMFEAKQGGLGVRAER